MNIRVILEGFSKLSSIIRSQWRIAFSLHETFKIKVSLTKIDVYSIVEQELCKLCARIPKYTLNSTILINYFILLNYSMRTHRANIHANLYNLNELSNYTNWFESTIIKFLFIQ